MGNLSIIIVAVDLHNMEVPSLITFSKGIKTTGDPDVTTPPVTDLELNTEATELQTTTAKRQIDKSEALTKLEKQQSDHLKRSVRKVANYVQQVANDVAIEAGNVEAGEAVVLRCGFPLKKKAEVHPRGFEVVDSGPGWTSIRVKAVEKKAGYLFRLGKTTKKGVPPTAPLVTYFGLECELTIINQTTGDIIGVQSASILPTGYGSKKAAKDNLTNKKSTLTPAIKQKKATFNPDTDPYNWSDFIYYIVE